MMDPTSHVDTDLLEYARHYGIAEDPMSKSPDSYLTDSGLDNLFPDPAPANPQPLRERYEELDSQLGHYLNNEKLDISIHEGRLLTSVRRLELDGLQLDWNEMLPPLQSIGSLRQEPLLKTQVEEERAREIRGRGAMELVNVDTSPDQPTSMELGKTSGTADGSPNCSRQSSVRLVQSQSNGRASHNSAAFVGTVLSISKTEKDKTPPRSSPAMPSPSMLHSSIRTDLGSLDNFMASRGIVMELNPDLSVLNDHTPGHLATSFGESPYEMIPVTLVCPPPIPENRRKSIEDQVLFLSSDLLKSHLPVIQTLETLPTPPTLVYRDYDAAKNVEDADIIVPPMTGIILTTAQALTQRPLPGEDQDYTCPILSRIYRIAPRYDYFYVLVVSAEMVDRRTADALAFLKVFCGKANDNAKIVPHYVSSDKVVDWVLALAFERGERG